MTTTTHTPQQQTILDLLGDGRWTCIDVFLDAHVPDYRKRLSELVAEYGSEDKPLPDGSWRFKSRYRTHENGKRRKDWRDTSKDAQIQRDISATLMHLRQKHRQARANPHTAYQVGRYGIVTGGKLAFYSLDELTRRVFEAWVDPYGGG